MLRDQGRGRLNWLRRSENEKTQAKERGEDISDEEAKRRAVAKLHRPKLRPLDNSGRYADPYDPRRCGTEIVLDDVSVALPKCWTMEPESFRAGRNYKKLTKQVARMIEQGKAQAGEICFICSEFFIFRHNGKDYLVQSDDPRYVYQIDKESLRASYVDGTVTLKGYSPISPKSVGVFAYYFNLYDALC
jgi:hypothetical protein